MMKIARVIQTLIISLMVLSLCCCSNGGSAGQDPLAGSAWVLSAYAGSKLIPGTSFTVEFAGGELQGRAGCNAFFGSYRLDGSAIEIRELGWTAMACLDPEGLMEQERTLMEFLGAVTRIQFENGRLLLLRSDGEALTLDPQK